MIAVADELVLYIYRETEQGDGVAYLMRKPVIVKGARAGEIVKARVKYQSDKYILSEVINGPA
jgi:predicted RNA-binding protein with TRAM domain